MQERGNAVQALWFTIAGSRKEYFARTENERKAIRTTAYHLYELGADFVAVTNETVERRGFVYVISHPSFPHHVKIGRAFDPESRLRGYQTGCPLRQYRLNHTVYFNDCYMAEREIHARLQFWRAEGEWFALQPQQAADKINQLRESI